MGPATPAVLPAWPAPGKTAFVPASRGPDRLPLTSGCTKSPATKEVLPAQDRLQGARVQTVRAKLQHQASGLHQQPGLGTQTGLGTEALR